MLKMWMAALAPSLTPAIWTPPATGLLSGPRRRLPGVLTIACVQPAEELVARDSTDGGAQQRMIEIACDGLRPRDN